MKNLNDSTSTKARGYWLSLLCLTMGLGLIGCATGDLPETPMEATGSDPVTRKNAEPDPAAERAFDEETCSYDAADEFEPRTRFTKGPWAGECHDTEKRRPVHFLSYHEANRFELSPESIAIANVYHEGAYWYAFVPKGIVKNVYFQLEYFPAVVPAGHTQVRIEYKEPVRLYGQSSWVQGEYAEVRNLVLSVEAVTRRGDQYDLVRGVQNHFAVAFRVTTLAARYASMVTEQAHHVEQWRLDMTEEEQENLLPFYVEFSDSEGLSRSYHTLFKNCTTEIIRVLDSTVEYTWGERIKAFAVKVSEIYPNIVRAALIARGLLPFDQSTDWYALEDDPSFPGVDPDEDRDYPQPSEVEDAPSDAPGEAAEAEAEPV